MAQSDIDLVQLCAGKTLTFAINTLASDASRPPASQNQNAAAHTIIILSGRLINHGARVC